MAAAAAPAVAKYGNYGLVTILETSGGLSKIHTDNDDEFWVKSERLKAVRQKTEWATAEPALDTTDDAWGRFAAYLGGAGYRLEVHARSTDVEQAEAEYQTWSGEALPPTAIHVHDNRPTPREWRLFFRLPKNIEVPFVIEIAGTTGRHPTNHPRGLLSENGRVQVYFASIIEQLVRAGLRV